MRKQFTKIITAFLAAVIVFVLSGCGMPNTAPPPQAPDISPLSSLSVVPFAFWNDPNDTHDGAVYTEDNERVSYVREFGLLVVEDKDGTVRPVMNPTDSTITYYDEESKEFTDGANRKLAIYLDSRLDKRYLKSGSVGLKGISLEREVFLISLRESKGSDFIKTIYAFREPAKKNFWETLNPTNWGVTFYAYYDMNNVKIDPDLWVSSKTTDWWRIALTWVGPQSFVTLPGAIFSNGYSAPVARILEQTTLRDLYEELSHATVHPWDGLYDMHTGLPVVTEDGKLIRVNPSTKQLTENMGWCLFNSVSGLPVVYYGSDIVTVNKNGVAAQQRVDNNVLKDVITVWGLLNSNTPFWIDTISVTLDGQRFIFDVPCLRAEDDIWVLLNGEASEGITDGITFDSGKMEDLYTSVWDTWFPDGLFGGGEGGGLPVWLLVIALVAVAVILVILYPVIKPVLTAIGSVIMSPVAAIKRKNKEKERKKKDGDNEKPNT